MRFTTARLCGGKSLMAISAEPMEIDLEKAARDAPSKGWAVSQKDEMMLVFQWNGMDVTLYSQGKVMFFPLEDRSLCIKYATEILESLRSPFFRTSFYLPPVYSPAWMPLSSPPWPSSCRPCCPWRRSERDA